MQITDAQIHIWKKDSPQRPWPETGASYAHGLDDFTAEDVLAEMDTAGVDRAVLVPPSFEGDYNDVCLAAAQAYPDRFAVMGRLDLADRSQAAAVPGWRQQPGMLGVRFTFARGALKEWLADGTADWFWPLASEAGIPVMIHAPEQHERIRALATAYPQLRLTVDHAGVPGSRRDEQIDPLIEGVLTLSDLANVAVKASSLPCVVSDEYPFPSLYPRIKRVFEAFGPQRTFWGSDLSRIPCSYRQTVTHFTEELDFLSDEDLEWVMGLGLERWLGWDVQR